MISEAVAKRSIKGSEVYSSTGVSYGTEFSYRRKKILMLTHTGKSQYGSGILNPLG